jgi:hypothetical protein
MVLGFEKNSTSNGDNTKCITKVVTKNTPLVNFKLLSIELTGDGNLGV